MGLRFLLDTSTLIEVLRGRNRRLINPLTEHSGSLATSSICVAELHYGALKASSPAQELAKVQSLLAKLQILEFDEHAAGRTAEVRLDLESRGTSIGSYDTQISGHAIAAALTVVTHNLKHFHRVEGLTSVDWSTPS